MRGKLIATCLFLLSAGCDSLDPLVRDAQEAVRRQLRDPGSAEFRDVRRCDKPNAVQGEVNARNGFGGYVGFTPFLYVNGEVAFLSRDDGLGPYTSFDADRWERLNRRCWSDDILRNMAVEPGALSNISQSPEQAADDVEREAENVAREAENVARQAEEALRDTNPP